MADFKPLLLFILLLASSSIFLTIFVNPFVSNTPSTDSILTGLISVIEDGYNVTIPVIGSFNFNPVTILWFGIDAVTTWLVDSLTSLSYLSDTFLIPLLILFLLAIVFVIVTLIRGN